MDAEHTEGSGPDDDTERDDEDGYGSGADPILPGSGDGKSSPPLSHGSSPLFCTSAVFMCWSVYP